jgi:hypothetical protein
MSKPVLTAQPITAKAMARSLAMAAIALAGLFLVSFISQVLPLQLLDPAWEFNAIQALINNASLPLVAFLCLQLAGHFDPGETALMARLRSWQRLAVPIACGFLLLIPLHGLASYRALKAAQANETAQMNDARSKLAKLREAVTGATTPKSLQQRLAEIPIAPQISDKDLNQPLDLTQRLLLGQLNDGFTSFQARTYAPRAQLRTRLLESTPKVAVSATLLAAFFASGAKRKNAEGTLLEGVREKAVGQLRGLRSSQTKAAINREKDQSIKQIERNRKAAFQERERREQQIRKKIAQERRKNQVRKNPRTPPGP